MLESQLLQRLQADVEAGNQLPTERALAIEFGVTRHAIRKVLNRLESEGKLWRHVGRGTFSGKRPEVTTDLAELGRTSPPAEIIEVRQMIEPQLAAAAALRASSAQIVAIETALQRTAAARTMDEYDVWDEVFHRTIVEAAGNRLLAGIFEVVNEARKDVVWATLRKTMFRPEIRAALANDHSRIADAIVSRDADRAWAAMRDHMSTLKNIYREVEDEQLTGRGSVL